MFNRKFLNVMFSIMIMASLLFAGSGQAYAKDPPPGNGLPHQKQGRITPADRKAASINAAAAGLQVGAAATAALAPVPGGTPDYFGSYANWAYSPLPTGNIITVTAVTAGSGYTAPMVDITDIYGTGTGASVQAVLDGNGGIIGFTNLVAGSGFTLGTSPIVTITDATGTGAKATATVGGIPVGGIHKFVDALPNLTIAVPDACNYSGQDADCYEIHLRDYTQKMHSDLPATTLRGYVQVKNGVDVAPISYLGPVIVAQHDRPVRIKFVNELPIGAGGNLFIPVDTTYMGAGMGPTGQMYTQNRATLHLHGGTTPWISDGTPHQWITPANENTAYPQGVSVQNVPDMNMCGAANDGCQTFYYSNAQSARLMFYHDHSYGITRLNVYAGEAAGYLLTDATEQGLISSGVLPGIGTPLVIQDKSFVDPSTIANQDPTWMGPLAKGSLWYPHVYMTNQNPYDVSGANAMGRWDYGPWFWPPFTNLQFGPIPNPYCLPTPPLPGSTEANPGTYDCSQTPWEPPFIPAIPNPSGVPEAFMDTPMVNGMAYPTMNVPAGLVRFRILNAANDRFMNLSLWVADPAVTTADGRTNTEVKMVPFNSTQNSLVPFPAWWYDSSVPNPFDDRVGGVPDPATRGPAMIQIGTEGGFLPGPALIKNQPVNYVMNKRDITVGNVLQKALFIGPAERADILVDFSNFAGKTLVFYNDSPAPVPAADPRLDYFTGNPDLTAMGGAPSTQAGFGPNTRTVMQIVVGGSGGTAPVDDYNPATLAALQAALPGAFAASQDTIIRPQAAYNNVYGTNVANNASQYVKISDTTHSFTPIGSSTAVLAQLQPKAIIEDFTMDFGRMNALLGNEIPNTNVVNQTSIPQGYIDPPNEILKVSSSQNIQVTPQGTLGDGTQLWKITHNGVDTHVIHTHMFVMQLINRVGWDGAIRGPDANELGWKDTFRMNPLEDIIVAVRPIMLTNLPFQLPNSIRPLDVTAALGSTVGFTNVDPNGNPVTPGIVNQLINFGWEYVYHCHILGHEENDMMRPVIVAVPPEAPSGLVATLSNGKVVLTWKDNSLNETQWVVQRANGTGVFALLATMNSTTGNTAGATVSYTDGTYKSGGIPFTYRVIAVNTVGSTQASNFTASAGGAYKVMAVNSAMSNLVGPPTGTTALSVSQAAAAKSPVVLSWTYTGTDQTGFTIQRATNNAFTGATTIKVAGNVFTYSDSGAKAGTLYFYRIMATNFLGNGTWSNVVSITPHP